jgi:glycosyltransferase involved in cell wall biosynthesis
METAPPDLIVVMPIYNEEANIAVVLAEWQAALRKEGIAFRILAVNDGSKDDTLAILRKLQEQNPAEIEIADKPNSGHGRSCRHGYDAAVRAGAGWILQIDSDGQCDPAFFAEFWRARESADGVFGLRVRRDDGFLRTMVSKACRFLTMAWTGVDLKDANVPYRLLRREKLESALRKVPADFDIHNIALTLALKRDPSVRWAYVPIRFRERQGGTNSINLPKIARMGWNMLRQIGTVGR